MRFVLRIVLGALIGVGLGLSARAVFKPSPSSSQAKQEVEPQASDSKPAAPVPLLGDGVEREETSLYPTGYVVKGMTINVIMSDGTVRTERDKEMGTVERNSVILDGKKVFIKPAKKEAKPDSPVTGENKLVLNSYLPAEASSIDQGNTTPRGVKLGADGVYRFERSFSGAGR
jgi:hypothetical protein